MDRRESIRSLVLGSLAGSILLESCANGDSEKLTEKLWQYQYGRTPKELEFDNELLKQQYFEESEINMITMLAELILPPNEKGTIQQAKVPEFIEFMAKDYEPFQITLRGGLMWLNNYCNRNYGTSFVNSSSDQQRQLLDQIAYPDLDAEEQRFEVEFFSLMRNLVVTGYFTSEVGIKELGYVGNKPNVWNGVPQDVLEKHGFSYDDWEGKFHDPTNASQIAKWDDEGNLIS
ncbi:MAG: gluconate 2-dehydrogenase subunit 3 family protein [Flavobacteriaceae bacterium]|nr:gluconate 2-dehydrogenase subunit 3 family protein [Flavobacteriaceae bacterium]